MEQNYTQHHIIFDIDSSSVGTLVFEYSFDKKTKKNIYTEVFSTREDITRSNKIDLDVFFERTLKTLDSVATSAHKYSGNDISAVYINVSAPWVSSQKRIIHFEKEREFIFTKEIGDSIINRELEEPLYHTRDYKNHKDLELIERRTVDVFANGYPTKKPYGKKVKDIDIHSLISVMSVETKKAFIHVIEKAFHIEEVVFFSNIFMTYQSILSLFPHENNITNIDISGEVTEITIIINDHLTKIGTIPFGMNHVIQKLSESLQIPFRKAESLMIMYQNNNLEDTYKESIENAMKKSFMLWFKNFYNFLDEVALEHIIPDTISLLAPRSMQNWLNEWILKTDEFGQHMHAQKNISLLDTKMLWRESQKTEFKNINDDNLALCLDFVEKNYLDKKV